jgi:hypothetical protein
MTVYELYYSVDGKGYTVITTENKYTYTPVTERELKSAMEYLASRAYVKKPMIKRGSKIATFTNWEDLINNYPEILL